MSQCVRMTSKSHEIKLQRRRVVSRGGTPTAQSTTLGAVNVHLLLHIASQAHSSAPDRWIGSTQSPQVPPWPTPGEPSRHVIPGPLFQFVHFPNAIFTDEERARTTRWGCSRGVHHQLDLALLEFSLISYGSADGPGFQKGIGPWQRTGPVWTAVVRLAIDRSIDRIYDVQQNPPSFIPLQCASRTNLL
jgi:hypothetical protein